MSAKIQIPVFKYIISASLIVIIVSVYPVTVYASKIQLYSFICGYIISLINALLGYKLNTMAFNKSVKALWFSYLEEWESGLSS